MNPESIHDIVRSISKTGGLGLVTDSSIAEVSSSTLPEKVELYRRVLAEAKRDEREWRGVLLQALSLEPDDVPAVKHAKSKLLEFVLWAATHEDRSDVMSTLEEYVDDASDEEIAEVRRSISSTGQDDLQPVLEELLG